MRTSPIFFLFAASMIEAGCGSVLPAQENTLLMPLPEEHTSLWWKEGFPGAIETAPWQQCLETGLYGFVFDSEILSFPHFGSLSGGASLESLDPAELALQLEIEGKIYRSKQGGEWSRFTGPRLIASGTFLQRFDVTDLVFEADDGSPLNVESRLEVMAWHDLLSLTLFARPGETPLQTGQAAFGKVGGGFGLDGSNRFDIPAEAIANPTEFSLSFEVFVPTDFQPTALTPWLLCKGANELADGNLGILLNQDGLPSIRINRGGGRENAVTLEPEHRRLALIDQWNHFLLTYDGTTLLTFLNGNLFAKKSFETPAPLKSTPITFGQRGDGFASGYPFRGIIDEVRVYSKIVDPATIRNNTAGEPTSAWSFNPNGKALEKPEREIWPSGSATVTLTQEGHIRSSAHLLETEEDWTATTLTVTPFSLSTQPKSSSITVEAEELASGEKRPVVYEQSNGWHRINLDGVAPISPGSQETPSHDALERIKILLSNPGEKEEQVRLVFEKTARGIAQRIGNPITGMTAMLRDPDGNPTGIPVQLSKNWHNHPKGGAYSGQWFHGITQLRLPPGSQQELELSICYGHWGGIPAASHAQLSLIGWGTNQRWDQSALGSWGESVCYEPDQAQGKCTVTDVRPFLVRPMNGGDLLNWTVNVGGADFFRLFDPEGNRLPHAAMQTTYHRYGPCLTEVTYSGRLQPGISHSKTVSIARTDDVLRATYRVRLDVRKPFAYSRFTLFQVGADTYNKTYERSFAVGNTSGLLDEWETQRGGDNYHRDPIRMVGDTPWISMHEGAPINTGAAQKGAWANRGIILRSWKAQLGGQPAEPWFAEFGNGPENFSSATADLVPPPEVKKLVPGDFVEATIEHVVLPQSVEDYLGPNESLKNALRENGNTWKMVEREANGNRRTTTVEKGLLVHRYPDIRIESENGTAVFVIEGGLGHVPITITGLSQPDKGELKVDGTLLDQSTHGNDFWQTNYDAESKTWSRTYNVRIPDKAAARVRFE